MTFTFDSASLTCTRMRTGFSTTTTASGFVSGACDKGALPSNHGACWPP